MGKTVSKKSQRKASKAISAVTRTRPQMRWAKDSPDGILMSRRAGLVDSYQDIARDWDRIAALALDFIHNSGRLKGAVDQVIADTVGSELKLNARPDMTNLGYTQADAATWARGVEARWRQWAWTPAECDIRGKFNIPQLVDVALRHSIAFGEVVAVLDWMSPTRRRRYGLESGTKVCLVSPHRLVRDTSPYEAMSCGVIHDSIGRPVSYRFCEADPMTGVDRKVDYPARDSSGRQVVVHVFDPWDADDVRGISVIAAALRTWAHAEKLSDATLTTAILQTVFAATLTSPEVSTDAFQALETLESLGEDGATLASDMLGCFGSTLDRAREGSISIDGTRISHLAPGEDLKLHSAQTPSGSYLPYANALLREMARCLGITFEALAMDHEKATYSSVRMSNASIWPVVLRRRERIAAPFCQAIYEEWLDEEIGEGRVQIRGGYQAFAANRNAVTWAEWQGPAKPTADDYKSAKAATERLKNGTTTLGYECAEMGLDRNDVIEMRKAEMEQLMAAGLPNIFLPDGAQSPNPDVANA